MRALKDARNELIDLEDMIDEELSQLQEQRLHEQVRRWIEEARKTKIFRLELLEAFTASYVNLSELIPPNS